MRITFLGTGTSQGVPVIACECEVCRSIDYRDKRMRSSVYIQEDGLDIIIDSGPDFRQQVLRERVHKLDAIIYTHEHRDHTAGLDEVRSFNFKQGQDIPIWARDSVIDYLKNSFQYIFSERSYPGAPRVKINTINGEPFQIQNLKIIPIEALHYKLPVYGFRIKDFTYITDANRISSDEMQKIKGSKVLVLNALQKKKHVSHFNIEEALQVADKIKPEICYLTHISHNLGLHKEVEEELPDHVSLAYDGLRISI